MQALAVIAVLFIAFSAIFRVFKKGKGTPKNILEAFSAVFVIGFLIVLVFLFAAVQR